MALKRSSEFLRLGTFFCHSGYNTKFKNAKMPSVAICSTSNHKCPGLYVGGGPRVVVSTAAFHARARGSVRGPGGLKETKMFLPHPRVKVSIVGSLRDREVACSASDRQGPNFGSCVWRTVSSHHPQEVLLAQLSLYVHKGGLKTDSFDLLDYMYSSNTTIFISLLPVTKRVFIQAI